MKPLIYKTDSGWRCEGQRHWDGGSTVKIAYERWYLYVYRKLPKY